MNNPGEGFHAPQCNGSNQLYAVVGMALSTINLWVEGSIPSLLTQVAQLVEQQFMQRGFESCSRSKRDSSAVEHNTQNVEKEVHRFSKNDDKQTKPGCPPVEPMTAGTFRRLKERPPGVGRLWNRNQAIASNGWKMADRPALLFVAVVPQQERPKRRELLEQLAYEFHSAFAGGGHPDF